MARVYIAGQKVKSNMRSNSRSQLIVCLALVSITPSVFADAVFRTTGEYGEVSFSDVELPGAKQIDVSVTVVDPARIADQQTIIEQQLRVAKALEESRLARQAAATERLLAIAAARPQIVYVEPQEYRSTNGYYFPRRLPRQHRKHRQSPHAPAVAAARDRQRGQRIHKRRFQPLYPGIPRRTSIQSGI